MSSSRYDNTAQSDNNFKPENEISRRNEFSKREVGFNHPDTPSFLRLNDDGDIEIFAAPGVGMVISAVGRSISLFADNIRVFSKDDGLRWNNHYFNYSATDYSEPTLIKIDYQSIHAPQNNAEYYLRKLKEMEELQSDKTITISGEYGFGAQKPSSGNTGSSSISTEGLTSDQVAFVESIAKEYSEEYLRTVIQYLKQDYTISQAKEKASEKHNA